MAVAIAMVMVVMVVPGEWGSVFLAAPLLLQQKLLLLCLQQQQQQCAPSALPEQWRERPPWRFHQWAAPTSPFDLFPPREQRRQ